MALTSGTLVGHYVVESLVGAGGMGEVYRARDTRLDRVVAIKVLPPSKAADPALRHRFEREARAIASLSHPHICALYDVGEHEGALYLVMEFLDGESLAQRLRRRSGSGSPGSAASDGAGASSGRGLPIEQALRHAIDVADALERAHRAGVVHRDLKPENVMLTKSGLKVVDFGLARVQTSEASRRVGAASTVATAVDQPISRSPSDGALTKEATVLGTMPYMAPEQLEGRAADARSDVFAFGALLYEMLVGRRAFAAPSEAALIASILEHDPEPPVRLRPDVPAALDRLVRVCLAKDPDERWQSAGDLKRELAWILEQGSKADEGGVPTAVLRRRRVRRVLAGAVALALCAVGLALGYGAGRRSGFLAARGQRRPQALRLQVPVAGMTFPADFALSPDGSQLALVQTDAVNHSLLWVRPLDGHEARPLAGTDEARLPFWSPDHGGIGFFAGHRLKRVDLATGDVKTLTAMLGGAPWGGSWGPDGTIVYAGDLDGLRAIDSRGGVPRVVLAYQRPYTLLGRPELVPGGGAVLLPLNGTYMDKPGVYLWPLDGSPGRFLVDATTAQFGAQDALFYFRDGTVYAQRFDPKLQQLTGPAISVAEGVDKQNRAEPAALSVSGNGTLAFRPRSRDTQQFVWYDRAGHVLGTLGEEADYGNFDLARDGPYLLVTRTDERATDPERRGVWMIDGARGGQVQLLASDALQRPDRPVWLPTRAAFLLDLERRASLSSAWVSSFARRRVEGGALETIPVARPAGGAAHLTDVSPDGRWLACTFLRYAGGRVSAVGAVAPLDGSAAPLTFGRADAIVGQVQFAPDGRHLAFHDDTSGRTEAYVTTMPPSEKRWPLSTSGGGHPRFRGDGREAFYLALDGTLMAVTVQLGDGVSAGVPRPLFRPKGRAAELASDRFAVSADGERFLVKTVANAAADEPITVISDWTALLPPP